MTLTAAQKGIADAMAEKELLQNVRTLAGHLGYRVYHTHDSRRSEPGFPDLVLARTGRVLFCELKRENGHITTEQASWLFTLDRAGVETHVYRPSQWLSGEIEAVLKGEALDGP